MAQHVNDPFEDTDRQIAWTLNNPDIPTWVKEALRCAVDQDPIETANHAEVLRCLLAKRSARWAEHELGRLR